MLMHHLIEVGAQRHPDRVALKWVERDHALTYAQLWEQTLRMAGALHHLGIRPGDRVGVVAHNGSDYVVAMLGAWRLGAIAALTSVRLAGQLDAMLADHTPSVVVYTHDLHTPVVRAARQAGARAWVCMDGPMGDGALALGELLAAGYLPPADPKDESAIAHLAYTSGTTGKPKGACLRHEPTVRASRCIGERLRLRSGTISLGATALSSSYGLVANLLPVWAVGGTVQIMKQWSAEAGWQALDETGATYFPANPPLLTDVWLQSRTRGRPPRALQLGVSGGGAVPPALKRAWRDELRLPLVESFGQSELGGFMALGYPELEPDDAKLLRVGPPLPDKEVWITPLTPSHLPAVERRIADIHARCAPGEVGAVVLRGGCMAGYWNRPDKTTEVIRGDCLITGDLGFMDADGYLTVCGRASEVLRVDGQDWFPREVEDVMAEHLAIEAVALIGLPSDDRGGVDPVVALTWRGQATASEIELRTHLARRLPSHAARVRFCPVPAMPLTPTGKIAKPELVQLVLRGPQVPFAAATA